MAADGGAVAAVVGFVVGSAIGLYRFRQEMRRPIDEDAPHPEDAFRDPPAPDPAHRDAGPSDT